MADDISTNTVELATELTIAWLGNHNSRVAADDVPAFLRAMHQTVSELSGGSASAEQDAGEQPAATFTPAVTARKVRIAERCVGWRQSELNGWLANPFFYTVEEGAVADHR